MASRVRQVKRQQQQNKTNRVTFALNGTGEVSLPGAPSLHTHSSKFPIEREVIVKSSNEKQCKIPNLSDYMRRAKPSVAPDAPPKQVAWTQQLVTKNEGESSVAMGHDIAAHQVYKAQPMSVMDSTKDSEPSPILRQSNGQDLGLATSTPETDGARGLPQRTYQSLKDMISSRFSKQNGNVGPTHPRPHSSSNTLNNNSSSNTHSHNIHNSSSNIHNNSKLKCESVDCTINQPTYSGVNSTNEAGMMNYNQESLQTSNYNGNDQRYMQSRPPLSQQQQYRGGLQSSGRNMSSARPPGGPIYQTTQNQNDYHPQQPQFSQGSVIVHAPQEGLPEDKPPISAKPVDQIHREGPQGAAALAGPSVKEDDDEGGFVKRGAQSDSGRGSTVYSSAKTSAEDTTPPLGEASEWSERVENELRQILNGPGGSAPPGGGPQNGGGLTSAAGAAAGSSESFSSVSPPLPPLSPHSSDDTYRRPRLAGYGAKGGNNSIWTTARTKEKPRSHKHGKGSTNLLCSGLEIDSMLDENNSSEDEDYTDTRAIRKQLEGLETMYSQVLKLLGVKKQGLSRYEASDPRINRRRTCGSISSAPSSVSSRPIRAVDRRGRAGKVRDTRGINKRFQRLESHVVTLARSVAHLSSEMRTQHIM
ncbi:hypothetical protein GE061_018800, partial [Apolygus lucorum]